METLSECPNLIALSRQSWLRGHFSSLFPDITFHLTSDILKCLGIFVCRLILHVSVYSLISLPSLCFHCVLVCSGCCKKNTIDWVTCTSDNSFYFSRCWWLGSPRSINSLADFAHFRLLYLSGPITASKIILNSKIYIKTFNRHISLRNPVFFHNSITVLQSKNELLHIFLSTIEWLWTLHILSQPEISQKQII